MLRLRPLLLTVVLMAILLASSGCGGKATPATQETAPVTIKLATQPWIGYGPWYIAQEKGFFAQRGLNVELVSFNTDQDLNAGLAAGQFDGANIATHTSILLANANVPVKAVLVMDLSMAADAILAGPEIASLEDLRGKKVAYEEGSTSDILLTYALSTVGMTKDDIQPVPMPADAAGSALIAGKVDAAVTYEPYISAALSQGNVNILYTAGEKPGLISDVLVFTPQALEEKGEAIRALLLAWQDAVDFLNSNPAEGQAIIAKAVDSPMDEFQAAWQGVKIYDLAENKTLMSGEIQSAYEAIGEVLKLSGEVESIPDPDTIFDPAYLP